jgi:hypothetical protein
MLQAVKSNGLERGAPARISESVPRTLLSVTRGILGTKTVKPVCHQPKRKARNCAI